MEEKNLLAQEYSEPEIKRPELYPFGNIEDLQNFNGFNSLIWELQERPDIYKFDHLQYLNDLYWFMGSLNRNIEYYYIVTLEVQDLRYQIHKTYGNVFFYHLLYLIRTQAIYEDLKTKEELLFIHGMCINFWIEDLLPICKSEFATSRLSLLYDFLPSSLDEWLTDVRRAEFNIAIYYYFREHCKEQHDIVKFYNTLYHYIGILNTFLIAPTAILNSILQIVPDLPEAKQKEETKALLYWLLTALRDKIGFERSLLANPDFEDSLKNAYSFFNGEAKILNCSPDQDITSKKFTALTEEQVQYYTSKQIEGETNAKPIINDFASVMGPFKLSKKLSKTNLIRILDVLFDGGYIEAPEKSKTEFMIRAGKLFSIDLSEYSNNLRPATNADFDYERIFKELGQVSKQLFESRIEEKRTKI